MQRLFLSLFLLVATGCGLDLGTKPAAERPGKTLAEASQAFEEGDLKGTIQILGRMSEEERHSRNGLLLQAHVMEQMGRQSLRVSPLTAVGRYEAAVIAYKAVAETYGGLDEQETLELGTAYYDLACSEALTGRPGDALEHLRLAAANGFDDLEFYEQDNDLASVRALPEYATFREETAELSRLALIERIKKYEPVPVDFTMTDLDKKTISMADWRGKVVIIDCWATWCPPCRIMLPRLRDFAMEHQDSDVKVLGLNFEGASAKEARRTVAAFLKTNPLPYPNALGKEGELPYFDAIPTMFFVDRSGKIRYELSGVQSIDRLETVVNFLLEDEPPAE